MAGLGPHYGRRFPVSCVRTFAVRYGGGTEIWRLRAPGMPLKHDYPRQPKSPQDVPVPDGKIAVSYSI